LHCVALGITVGAGSGLTERRRYDPLGSADFLAEDLRRCVGRSGRPVVLVHHLNLASRCRPCDKTTLPKDKEWDACDIAAFHEAITGYNVVAIFCGHTHARSTHRWDGVTAKAETGVALFNVDDAAHFAGRKQGMFYVELADSRLTIREYATLDGWKSAAWTPQTWSVPLATKS
jgi:hypothetical protein